MLFIFSLPSQHSKERLRRSQLLDHSQLSDSTYKYLGERHKNSLSPTVLSLHIEYQQSNNIFPYLGLGFLTEFILSIPFWEGAVEIQIMS